MTEVDESPHESTPRVAPRDGRYRLGEELARGGMGVVRVAVDERLGRNVAVKQLLAPLPATRARFEREARITACLEHPGVVPIYDRGTGDDGEPFYVMRKVAGKTLAETIDACGDLRARLALIPVIQAVIDTLAYAHAQQIIHRDLKPSNVLVGAHGETLVIDWGLAKKLGDADEPLDLAMPDDDQLTRAGAVIGTPKYMAPEQAAGAPCDARSDVYALGAILYQALGSLAPGCPRELVAIVGRAMAKEPADRYADASAFAADLRAFSSDQLVSAHHYTWRQRVMRWVRRHRAAVAVGAPLVVALIVTAIVAAQRVRVQRDRAVSALAAVEGRDRELALRQAEASLVTDPTTALAWAASAGAKGDAAWRARSIAQSAAASGVAREVHAIDGIGPAVDGERAVFADSMGNVWLWAGALSRIATKLPRPRAIAFGNNQVVVGSDDGTVTLVELSGTQRELAQASGTPVRSCAIGTAIWCGDTAGKLRRFGTSPSTIDLGAGLQMIAVRGDRWVVGLDDGTIVLEGQRLQRHARSVGILRFLDDDTLLSAGEDGRVLRWSLSTGAATELVMHADWVSALAISEDGTLLATGSGDRTIVITSLATTAPPITLRGHRAAILGLGWHRGMLVSSALDGTLRWWNPQRGDSAIVFAPGVRRLVWLGDTLLTLGGAIRLWTETPEVPQLAGESAIDLRGLAHSPDARWLVAMDRERHLLAWNLATRAAWQVELASTPSEVRFVGPDEVVVATERGGERWNLATHTGGPIVDTFGTHPQIFRDGRIAIIDSQRSAIAVYGSGEPTRFGPIRDLAVLSLSPDEATLASGDIEGNLERWTIATSSREKLGTLTHIEAIQISTDGVWTLALDRSGAVWAWPRGGAGRQLDLGGDAREIRITSANTAVIAVGANLVLVDLAANRTQLWRGHRARIDALELTGDGLALTGDRSGELRAWRLADGASTVIPGRFRAGTPISYGPDRRVAAQLDGGAIIRATIPAVIPAGAGLEMWFARTTARLDAKLEANTPR